ncbi:type II toxin-antitoxin system PemK/MazF family toxin [Candidatus Micrarchaeota archaeon CG08_land_8_20_14_0_20_59_11]|nr:MAG: type II toxin-antitoxin system PemK/MazF family toxin [Candidatus Micrarchaeota archaeon CG08_land_8_20_14_0_20_59_11]
MASVGEIWRVNLGGEREREQGGTRPALVVGKANGLAVVVPFTKNTARLSLRFTEPVSPTRENGLAGESVALVFQITALDERFLVAKLGWLSEKEREPIRELLRNLLHLGTQTR